MNSDGIAHRRRVATQRTAQGRRRWRVASALAASLIAAVAVWSAGNLHRSHLSAPTTTASDRIFSSLNEEYAATKSNPGRDEIFSGDFRSDEIFNASRHNNG